jgi:hypothetical protein
LIIKKLWTHELIDQYLRPSNISPSTWDREAMLSVCWDALRYHQRWPASWKEVNLWFHQ